MLRKRRVEIRRVLEFPVKVKPQYLEVFEESWVGLRTWSVARIVVAGREEEIEI